MRRIKRIKLKKILIRGIEIFLLIILIIFLLIILSAIVIAPPSPHNIEGQVFIDNSKSLGVSGNLPVRINNTISGDTTITYTEDPGPLPLRGIYSVTINGNNGDLIIVTSWNSTHYGMANTSLSATTTTIDVVYNLTRPSEINVTILVPSNNGIRNTTNLFNVTANITMLGNDGANCNATISFSSDAANITSDQNISNILGNINFHDSTTTTWNVSGLKEGAVNITVSSKCSSDTINLEGLSSYTINLSISDTTKPTVNLIYPLNNSWSTANVTFKFNATESTGLKNCSLFFDNKLNQTNIKVIANAEQNFTINNSQEGSHNWFISCIDNSSKLNQGNSSVYLLHIDGTFPNITLLFPNNNTVITNYSVSFQYNVTDNFNVTNCSLILNNQVAKINYTVIQNTSNYFNMSLAGANYNWSINCSDGLSNIGDSGYFTLSAPDLKINFSDIVLSINKPIEAELIEINATIFNIGYVNTTSNLTVQFFENDPDVNGVQIGKNITINVTAGGNITVSINYSARIGKADIFVILDPPLDLNGSIIELNETNNKANISIFVPAYHIYFGIVKSDIVLDTSQNFSVFEWANITSFKGNIFASDSDSLIDFSSLQSLGKNTSNNLTFDDFQELDLALNMTNLSDSINRTYTDNNAIKNAVNITIFSKMIEDVPIVNSTNSSNFVTGILWDTSDINKGQFNGSQDVVFITKVSKNSIGSYGNYDYEIKIPSVLRRYLKPNQENTITFYREIT